MFRGAPGEGMSEADTKVEDGGDVRAQDSKVRILLARAADFLHEDRVGEARMDLAQALRSQPNNEQAKNLLGLCLFRLGDLSGAKKLFAELIGKNKNEASLYLNLAMVQLKAEDFADARTTLEVALELQPGHRRAAGFLGLTLERLGLFHDAGVWYDKAEQHDRAAEMRKKAQAKASAAATRRALNASSALAEPPEVSPAQFADATPPHPAADVDADAEDLSSLNPDETPQPASSQTAEPAHGPTSQDEYAQESAPGDEEVPEPPPLTGNGTHEHGFVDDNMPGNAQEMPQVFDFDLSAEMERFSDSLLEEAIEEDSAAHFSPPDLDPAENEDASMSPATSVEAPEVAGGNDAEHESGAARAAEPGFQPSPWQPPAAVSSDEDETSPIAAEETTQIAAPPPPPSDVAAPTELDPALQIADDHERSPTSAGTGEESAHPGPDSAQVRPDGDAAQPQSPPAEAYPDDGGVNPDAEQASESSRAPSSGDISLPDGNNSEQQSAPNAEPLDDGAPSPLEPPPPHVSDGRNADASASYAASPVAQRVFESLQDLVTERLESLSPEDDPRIEGELFRFPVRGKAFVRSDLVVSLSGDLKSAVVYREYQGERTDGFFGGETQGIWEIQGLGLAYLDVSELELTQLYLTKENIYLLESALVAFGVGFSYENGRLPDEDGEDLDLVQIEGSGFIALGTQTPLYALQVKDRYPVHVRADRLVGFTGDLLPSRLSTSAPLQPVPHSALQFEGNGFVLTR